VLSRGHQLTPVAFVLAALLLLAFPAPSPAPVAPRKCGEITVKSRDYLVKADQIRCRTARRWARRYLGQGFRPSGYTCRNGDSQTQLRFRCWKREKTYFAIKR
jgi:hypothetical protein